MGRMVMVWSSQVRGVARRGGGERLVVGDLLVDEFLGFAGSRTRANAVRACARDLKAFFTIVGKEPAEIRPANVMGFAIAPRRPGRARRRWCGSLIGSQDCGLRPSARSQVLDR
jgi:hypothetical protein